MCQKTAVTHSACGHDVEDTFPCETFLDTGSCPSYEPKTTTEETNCPSCEEDAHLAAAMKQIETDASLAAVPITVKDPSAPKRWAKSREHFIHCGHFANVTQQDFEVDDNSPEYITEELRGSCHRCCAALDWQIEQKKERGEWNEDPWGEMQKLTTAEAIRSAGGDVGPSRRPATATAAGPPPARQDFDPAVELPAPVAALPGARYVDYGGEDGNGDTTPNKNKGVVDRAPRMRITKPESATEPESDAESEPDAEHDLNHQDTLQAGHGLAAAPTDLLDDPDAEDFGYPQTPAYTPAPPGYRAYRADDSSDDSSDEEPAHPRAPRSSAPSPPSVRSYSRSPPLSPSGHLDLSGMAIRPGDEDVDAEPLSHDAVAAGEGDGGLSAGGGSAGHGGAEAYVDISPEERAKYAIPGLLNLTAAGFENLKRRLAEGTGKHMTDYRAGVLSERDK